jgi:hypothetical protein
MFVIWQRVKRQNERIFAAHLTTALFFVMSLRKGNVRIYINLYKAVFKTERRKRCRLGLIQAVTYIRPSDAISFSSSPAFFISGIVLKLTLESHLRFFIASL